MSEMSSSTPSHRLDEMIKMYLENFESIPNDSALEMEVKFGTLRGDNNKPISRNEFDNVAKKLRSFGFVPSISFVDDPHMLRIFTTYVNSNGQVRQSNVRVNIPYLSGISQYCRDEQINDFNAGFEIKDTFRDPSNNNFVRSVDFDDFNFRVSLNEEGYPSGKIRRGMIEKWKDMNKKFRLMNRTTFQHPDYPFKLDLSIVKSSYKKNATTFNGSGVLDATENYEIEIEVDNDALKNDPVAKSKLGEKMRKVIKIVLSGLQSTNYPVSIPEQEKVKHEYMATLFPGKVKRQSNPPFIGPSSYTLQLDNIVDPEVSKNGFAPNIRVNYTVTDKADGERKLMFISSNGRIYLIDTNMNIQFTGAITQNKKLGGTVIDGEHIKYNKKNMAKGK